MRTVRPSRAAARGGSGYGARRTRSPPLEFGSHQYKRQRLRFALGASDSLARRRRSERTERCFHHRIWIEAFGGVLRKGVGRIEPMGEAVGPGIVVIGKALRRRWPPERL